jgi:hypothetical protein
MNMENEQRFDRRSFYLTSIFLIGAAMVLAACGPSDVPTPALTAEAPVVPTPTVVPTPMTYEDLWKSSPHADDDAEAFRHWDAMDPQEIPTMCAQCHSRTGFLDFLGVDGTAVDVVDSPKPVGTTITCYVCHNEATYTLDSVTFTSGEWVGGLGPEARCITCHQGRGSTSTVNKAIENSGVTDEDTPSEKLLFINSHSTAAATSFGSEVHGAYEYDGQTYKGRYSRGGEFFTCIKCHDQHSLELRIETCVECHTFDGVEPRNIRVNSTDFDGDGNTTEGVFHEVEQVKSDLFTAIQEYARDVVEVPIVYDLSLYPYFFLDTNENGKADLDEVKAENRYNSWTPRLLRAAYNYNYSTHDAAAYSHNSTYILQVLYDSLEDIGGDISGISRP